MDGIIVMWFKNVFLKGPLLWQVILLQYSEHILFLAAAHDDVIVFNSLGPSDAYMRR